MLHGPAKSAFQNETRRYLRDHLSIIKRGPTSQSKLYFQVLQVAHCYLIPALLFSSLSEAPREAEVPEATHRVPPAVSSQQDSGRYTTSTGSRHSPRRKRALQNGNKAVCFKPNHLC